MKNGGWTLASGIDVNNTDHIQTWSVTPNNLRLSNGKWKLDDVTISSLKTESYKLECGLTAYINMNTSFNAWLSTYDYRNSGYQCRNNESASWSTITGWGTHHWIDTYTNANCSYMIYYVAEVPFDVGGCANASVWIPENGKLWVK
jgi:hypothetical protein